VHAFAPAERRAQRTFDMSPAGSIAVDPDYIPLAVPVWVDTKDPLGGSPLRGLFVLLPRSAVR
jgi:membrane-bound lytic murein transglycosylase